MLSANKAFVMFMSQYANHTILSKKHCVAGGNTNNERQIKTENAI